MTIPKPLQNLIDSFERLPGIGPKTAQRLTYYLLHVPQEELDKFSSAVVSLKKDTVICSICFSVGETDPCNICSDDKREKSLICVVEQPLDVLAIEKGGRYQGVYHVLHGKIDPLNNIGPDEIYIADLVSRVKNMEDENIEVILATNPTMEGEATAMYISRQLKTKNADLKVTRIGRGLPVGADLEYADEITLRNAMEGRSQY